VVMALVLAGIGGLYYWGPKMTGYCLHEGWGKLQFWLLFIGTQVAFMPQYWVGLLGMPRRTASYPSNLGWQSWNVVSTIGAYMIGLSFIVFVVNLLVSWRRPIPAGNNPFDGHTLEWWTTSPPPHHNFNNLPPIRSERPVWDANHPDAPTLNSHGKTAHPVPEAAGVGGN